MAGPRHEVLNESRRRVEIAARPEGRANIRVGADHLDGIGEVPPIRTLKVGQGPVADLRLVLGRTACGSGTCQWTVPCAGSDRSPIADRRYQVSMYGYFLPVRGTLGGIRFKLLAIQLRVSAGSITSSSPPPTPALIAFAPS